MNTVGPLRVAILNDYEIVVRGLARMFEPYSERLTVVEAVAGGPVLARADIALYDTFSQSQDIGSLLADCNARRLVVYSWNLHPELVGSSLEKGASGYLGKRLPAAELVDALDQIHAGVVVVTEDDHRRAAPADRQAENPAPTPATGPDAGTASRHARPRSSRWSPRD